AMRRRTFLQMSQVRESSHNQSHSFPLVSDACGGSRPLNRPSDNLAPGQMAPRCSTEAPAANLEPIDLVPLDRPRVSTAKNQIERGAASMPNLRQMPAMPANVGN